MLNEPINTTRLEKFPDIVVAGGNAFEIREYYKTASINFPSGNRIIFRGQNEAASLKNTFLYFNGKNNTVIIENIRGVHGLEVACLDGSLVQIKRPSSIRGLTILCSGKSKVSIDSDCLISRDVLIYASGAHALYNVQDGTRRSKHGIEISKHVWLGQGSRILTGARIGSGSVIGSYGVLSGSVPNNCAAAGNPCKVTSKNIFWTGAGAVKEPSYYDHLESSGKRRPSYIKLTED